MNGADDDIMIHKIMKEGIKVPKEMRCFCPPDKKHPCSPATVRSPQGQVRTSASSAHIRNVVMYQSLSIFCPNKMFSRTVIFCIHGDYSSMIVIIIIIIIVLHRDMFACICIHDARTYLRTIGNLTMNRQ
jgi:hypothetical protein